MRNCLVAQSGGPTAAINSSLSGVLEGAMTSGEFKTVYGALHGVQGLLNKEIINLSEKANEIEGFLENLKHTPAMYLGSCRFMLPDASEDSEIYEKVFSIFDENEIDAFFYIGGNDSMDTVAKLSSYAKENSIDVKVIGVPKTIDNDLYVTDHTPGYGSAAKFIATTLLEVGHDTSIYPIDSVTIVEIMGRDAGWLVGAAALARNKYNKAPHLIYFPEVPVVESEFIADVKDAIAKYHNVVIATSEGIKNPDGEYISSTKAAEDKFAHSQLSGAAKVLEYMIKENIEVKVRSVEVNIPQRTASHLQSLTDIEESFDEGAFAVTLALDGHTGEMVTIKRVSDEPYITHLSSTDVNDAAGLVKHVPREWINDRGNDVTEDFIKYAKPLIEGETSINYKDGIPDYLDISHLEQ